MGFCVCRNYGRKLVSVGGFFVFENICFCANLHVNGAQVFLTLESLVFWTPVKNRFVKMKNRYGELFVYVPLISSTIMERKLTPGPAVQAVKKVLNMFLGLPTFS